MNFQGKKLVQGFNGGTIPRTAQEGIPVPVHKHVIRCSRATTVAPPHTVRILDHMGESV
jgi:hypothetical protein|tara:strand:- start:158 stop:334 length:177 start_codon:yes stop_codon:yes gene_type:complete